MTNVVAYTKPGISYPGYVNLTRQDNGSFVLTVRGDSTTHDGVYICGYRGRDTGLPGRCTPGDANCNNYCNMAPEKGPMVDAPPPCTHTKCGDTVQISLTPAEAANLIRTMGEIV